MVDRLRYERPSVVCGSEGLDEFSEEESDIVSEGCFENKWMKSKESESACASGAAAYLKIGYLLCSGMSFHESTKTLVTLDTTFLFDLLFAASRRIGITELIVCKTTWNEYSSS